MRRCKKRASPISVARVFDSLSLRLEFDRRSDSRLAYMARLQESLTDCLTLTRAIHTRPLTCFSLSNLNVREGVVYLKVFFGALGIQTFDKGSRFR